ncbi:monovalent cation/H+ antiporter subunit D [Lutibaculum baratangense]|uniref:Na(+) H(+) antiporter subunit D n=1 Tax=Lutibaculum baratangense AMV1 TaxID=631454 RepID=V4RV35_9HYPH|nr:monovalent cation/H+ antiporter subunit D [Lutibaculum baratangense]ESR26880.1 Na(+) H(+) antiporter subunit D [Lutibaculum baratangense AMV1]
MVNHWIILPVILPALTAAVLVLMRHAGLGAQRWVSVGVTAFLVGNALYLWSLAAGGPEAYFLGDWPAPFGIVLVLDRLSALMLVVTSVIALAALLYAVIGWDARGQHFHALFQFQLLGINGAFLTGDLFNLFVFFEILLIASYGLVLHGGGAWRMKSGFQYVAINLVASTVFLFGVGLIYGVTGTLNMADLAVRVSQLPPENHALLSVGSLLLFSVFAMKCALAPFHWWLPTTYSATSAPAVALFAVLTKVGAYAIIRVHTLVFASGVAGVSDLLQQLLLPAAALTLIVGSIGVLASKSMLQLASFSIVASMGTLLIAGAGIEERQIAAALYYLLHSCLVGAVLFLIVDIVAAGRGTTIDRLVPEAATPRNLLLAALFFGAAIAMVGMPPLSGFVGKVAILSSIRENGAGFAGWAVILGTSLLLLVGYLRAGSTLFWKAPAVAALAAEPSKARPVGAAPIAIVATLLVFTGALTVLGGPVMDAMTATARELLDQGRYIGAVLPETDLAMQEP